MNNYQMFRKIQEQAKVYEEYNNFDREDLIDELVEEKRINENNLEEIERLNNIIDGLEKYLNEDDWTSVNGVIAVNLIKNKLNELKGDNK